MRAAAVLVACALVVATGCGGSGGEAITTGTTATGATGATGASGGPQPAGCTQKAGEVVDLLPVAERGCTRASLPVETGDALFTGSELTTTDSPSTLRFDLELASSGTAHCGMSADAAALIRPDAATDLKVLDGSVSCDIPSAATFAAPGAQVDVTGTFLSLTADGDTTTIRLYEGTVDVHSAADGSVQQLAGPGESCPAPASPVPPSQAVVTTSAPMQQTAYAVDPAELAVTGIVKLRIGLVPTGALEGFANGMNESKATVVTATAEQQKVMLGRSLFERVPLVTAAALKQPPVEQTIQPGETVVGVGSIPALLEAFCRIRSDVPDAKLVYTPFAFAGAPPPDTGTTATESVPTSTETGTGTTTTP